MTRSCAETAEPRSPQAVGSAGMLQPTFSLLLRQQVQIDNFERQSIHDVFEFGLDGVDQILGALGDEDVDVGVQPEATGLERADQ